jgi:hypothetical protein
METYALDVAVVSLSNNVNNFKIRRSSGGISVQVPSCKYKPTTITNDGGNQKSSSGVMTAKDTRHFTLVQTAVACVSLQISSSINSKFRLFSLSS